ncbi:hypothetical protein T261_0837 [Streptomyces lydicus]|nr:hypothetical protein T261_0837 [Streptomyces lydicus]
MTLAPTGSAARTRALERAASNATAALASDTWPDLLADELRELNATWQESAQVCADVAWQARAAGRSALHLLSPEQIIHPSADPVTARTMRHLYLASLRYDFRCPSIESLVHKLPEAGRNDLDCYSRALCAFALLGQSRTEGLSLMERVLDEADDHPKTLHVVLHGLWLGHALPGREEHMLALLARPPFAQRTDPIALFREANALRGLGRYPSALASIDRALDLLPPGDLSVHADLVRERSLITASLDAQQISARGASGSPQ